MSVISLAGCSAKLSLFGHRDPVPHLPTSTLTGPGNAPPGVFDLAEPDPELLALPAPPKKERTVTVIVMGITAIAAAGLALALRGEALYAISSGQPADLGELASLRPKEDLDNRYVRATGLLGTQGAIRYGRAAEGDSFRLAPIAGTSNVWVEIRVPEGFEGPRYVPPTSFAGRLVPFKKAGVRHVGLASAARAQTGVAMPEDAWLLIDGGSPRASRWAVALAALFVAFAVWNLLGVARVLGRVKDGTRASP